MTVTARARVTLLMLVAVLAACGPNARQTTLKASLMGLNAARDGFSAFDAVRQGRIVDAAKSQAEGQAELAAYRASRDAVTKLFEAGYHALAGAAILNNDPTSLSAAVAAAGEAIAAWNALKGPPI